MFGLLHQYQFVYHERWLNFQLVLLQLQYRPHGPVEARADPELARHRVIRSPGRVVALCPFRPDRAHKPADGALFKHSHIACGREPREDVGAFCRQPGTDAG